LAFQFVTQEQLRRMINVRKMRKRTNERTFANLKFITYA
jgi:hypothetical protein